MISELGDNLTILLVANVGDDWQAFAAWYSIQKNLPYAKCVLAYIRHADLTPFQLFQWSKRLGLKSFGVTSRKQGVLADQLLCLSSFKQPCLLLPATCMVLSPLSEDLLTMMNSDEPFVLDETVDIAQPMFSKLLPGKISSYYDSLILTHSLPAFKSMKMSWQAKVEQEPYSIIDYSKGCGKWIHTMRGCPFSSAGGLLEEIMTINEHRIINLWKKMVCLYSSVA